MCFISELIWKNLGDSLRFVFEVVWTNFGGSFCLVFEVIWLLVLIFVFCFGSRFKESRNPLSCFWSNLKESRKAFVICSWSRLEESRNFVMSFVWSNLKESIGFFVYCFWSNLLGSCRPLFSVFEVVWKNLKDLFCFVFEVPKERIKESSGVLWLKKN